MTSFENIVGLAKAVGVSVDEQMDVVIVRFGDNVFKYFTNTAIWTKYRNGKFVRAASDFVAKELEKYQRARSLQPVPVEKVESFHEKLVAYLVAQSEPVVSGEPGKEYQGWIIDGMSIVNQLGTENWKIRMPGEKFKAVTPGMILKAVKPEEEVDLDAEFAKLDVEAEKELPIEEVKEEVVVDESLPLPERLLRLVESLMGRYEAETTQTIYYLKGGGAVLHSALKNTWEYCSGPGMPFLRYAPERLIAKLLPKPEVKRAAKLEQRRMTMHVEVKKLAGLTFMKGTDEVVVRTPFTNADRLAGSKFDKDVHFRADGEYPELSQLLEEAMTEPYIEFVTDDPSVLQKMINRGYPYRDESGIHERLLNQYPFNGKKFRVFFGYQRDDKGKAFLVAADSKLKDLRDIGVRVRIDELASQGLKAGKYLNRLTAPTWREAFGISMEWDPEAGVGKYRLENGEILTGRFVSLKGMSDRDVARTDGGGELSPRFCRVAGLSRKDGKLGDAYQMTFDEPHIGMGKGNFTVKPDSDYDFVVYGSKEMVKRDKLYIGCFGKLKKIMPRTDMQAWCNFRFERPGMADHIARLFREEFWESIHSDENARKALLSWSTSIRNELFNDGFVMDDDPWVLRNAVTNGISILRHPGLYRKYYNFMIRDVMNLGIGRVPMHYVAGSGYVVHDPFAVDPYGNLLPEDQEFIKEGECVYPDAEPGSYVVCYRQPSEDQNAWVKLRVVYDERYAAFKGTGIIVLGAGCQPVLERLGGGDLDDRFIVVTNPVWVERFEELNSHPYLETERLGKGASKDSLYKYPLTTDPYYNNRHFLYQIAQKKKASAGIGPAVNFIMIDYRLSHPDDREFMLKQLEAALEEAIREAASAKITDLQVKKDWFVNRQPYQARLVATNLERVIDGNVMDQAMLTGLGDVGETIRQFHLGVQDEAAYVPGINEEGTLIYPWFATFGKKEGQSRIPASKMNKNDYLVLDCLLDKSLKDLRRENDILLEKLKLNEWRMVAPAGDIVVSVVESFGPEIKEYVGDNWRDRTEDSKPGYLQVWRASIAQRVDEDMDARASKAAWAEVHADIDDYLAQFDDETLQQMALELYCFLYYQQHVESRVDPETGLRMSFSDGSLWAKRMGTALVNGLRSIVTLDEEGARRSITGLYVPVSLYDDVRYLGSGLVEVVVMEKGSVYRKSDGRAIGDLFLDIRAEGVRPGEFVMKDGIVELRKTDPSLMPVENFDWEEIE